MATDNKQPETVVDANIRLDRIVDSVIEDLADCSEQEFAAIVGPELNAELSKEVASIVESAKAIAARNILENARGQVVSFWSAYDERRGKPSNSDPRQRLERLLQSNPGYLDGMTLAARNGQEVGEEDFTQMIEDLELLEALANTRKG